MSSQQTKPRRETWSGQTAFLISAIGSAIGLGNIWRFPGVAYANGGGAFLVPYLVSLVCVGIPILFLDYAIGHKLRGSPPWALRRMTAGGEFLGWFQVGVCFVIFIYYAAVVAWAASYAWHSITLAWGDDSQTFFLETFLQLDGSDSVSWTPVLSVLVPLAVIWLFVLFIVGRGLTKGVELANRIFLPLLVILFVVMVVRALFLPGAMEGLNAFFTPQWDQLTNPHVWLAAFAQIFYSLSVGFGIMATYASYLKPKSNLTGTGLVAGFANSSFELLAGIGVFAALGFMAHAQQVGVNELEGLTGPILSFVTFPQIISMMPGGPIFGVLFFTSLTLAGITSLLSLLQVVSGSIQDKFGLTPRKAAMIMGVPAMVLSLGLFGVRSGLNVLDVIDTFVNNIGVVASAMALCLLSAFAGPRLKGLRAHLNSVSSIRVPAFWDLVVGVISPIVLGFMLISALIDYVMHGYDGHATSFVGMFGWGMLLAIIVFAVIMTVIKWHHSLDSRAKGLEQ